MNNMKARMKEAAQLNQEEVESLHERIDEILRESEAVTRVEIGVQKDTDINLKPMTSSSQTEFDLKLGDTLKPPDDVIVEYETEQDETEEGTEVRKQISLT